MKYNQPWPVAIANGIPELVVWNRPMTVAGVNLAAGTTFPVSGNEQALRRLFDLNYITTRRNYDADKGLDQAPPKKTLPKKR